MASFSFVINNLSFDNLMFPNIHHSCGIYYLYVIILYNYTSLGYTSHTVTKALCDACKSRSAS